MTSAEPAGQRRPTSGDSHASTSSLPQPPPAFSSPQPLPSFPASIATNTPPSKVPHPHYPYQHTFSASFDPSPAFAFATDPAVSAPHPPEPSHAHQQPQLPHLDTSSSALQPASRSGPLRSMTYDFTPEQGAEILENLVQGNVDLAHSKMAEVLVRCAG